MSFWQPLGIFLGPVVAENMKERSALREQNSTKEEIRAPKEWKVEGDLTEFHALDGDSILFSQGDKSVVYTVSDMENGLNHETEQ